ncbi:MAG: sensor domain-containing diguanylate cyclase, partial [Steroidobacteraceae bacterium]|nr:sensor domain-containing diguanylate cyclase [Deltaproteobacteria bacterium]
SDALRHAAQESEKRFRGLVDGLDAIVWEADADTIQFTFISHQVENLFFISVEEWLTAADFFKEQIFPDDREWVLEACRRSVEQEVDCQLEYRRIRRDNSIVWVQDNIRIIVKEEGQKKQLRGVMVDVSKKRHAEDALNALNRELQTSVQLLEQRNLEVSTFHELSEMFQLCRDREEAYRIIGVAALKLFPEDSGAFFVVNSSRNMLDLTFAWGETVKHESHFSPDSCWALRRRRTTSAFSNNQLLCKNITGEITPRCVCIPMLSQDEIVGVFHLNITGAEEQINESNNAKFETKYQLAISMTEHVAMAIANLSLRETLRDLSIRDPLTGLFNRRYLEEALLREIMLAERMKRKFGVIMMDLDHFKRFNDLHGHDAGDSMLREFGSFLLNNIREYDIACRYGGEEFICIFPETTLENALERAEELRSNLMTFEVKHLGRPLGRVTISAGVAIYPEHGTSQATIVKAADEALYRAKNNGRNRVMAAVAKEKIDSIEEAMELNSE